MGYDGGYMVKIKNKKLGEVLDEFADKGYFQEGNLQGLREQPEFNDMGKVIKPKVKYTLFDAYWDSAYVEGCPKSIQEVGNYIVDLIRAIEFDINEGQLYEIQTRIQQEDVINDYEYVNWQYYLPDWEIHSPDDDMVEFVYKK